MRRGPEEGALQQRGDRGRKHHVPGLFGSIAKGTCGIGTLQRESQDHCASGEEVLGLDWRFDPRIPEYFSGNVDICPGV